MTWYALEANKSIVGRIPKWQKIRCSSVCDSPQSEGSGLLDNSSASISSSRGIHLAMTLKSIWQQSWKISCRVLLIPGFGLRKLLRADMAPWLSPSKRMDDPLNWLGYC
jgi:hypothetical protein